MDTTDYLKALQTVGIMLTDCWLVTIDVVDLYTSNRMLGDSGYTLGQKKFIMEMLGTVLHENYFMFQDFKILYAAERIGHGF